MSQIRITALLMVLTLCLTGCAEQRLKSAAAIDEAWDEDLNREAKKIAVAGQCGMGITQDTQDGTLFFNERKPQIKTVQLWLESGKVLSSKIKAYLDTILPASDTSHQDTSPARALAGRWYGLDRKHEGAIIFTFDPTGRFTWTGPDLARSGTFEIDHSVFPHRITLLSTDLPRALTTSFEFVNENALILKGKERDVVLFKKGDV